MFIPLPKLRYAANPYVHMNMCTKLPILVVMIVPGFHYLSRNTLCREVVSGPSLMILPIERSRYGVKKHKTALCGRLLSRLLRVGL